MKSDHGAGTQVAARSAASRFSLAAALRPVFNELIRLLEKEDPSALLRGDGAFSSTLEAWRSAVEVHTSGASRERLRELENDKLKLLGQQAQLEKENQDLRLRNKELLDQIVRLNAKEQQFRQRVLEAQFAGSNHQVEAKRLDLEVRELRRRVRELEGGPPLSAAEAAPESKSWDEPVGPATIAEHPTPGRTAVTKRDDWVPTGVAHLSAPPSPTRDPRAAAEAAFRALSKPAHIDGTDNKAAKTDAEKPKAPVAAAGERRRPKKRKVSSAHVRSAAKKTTPLGKKKAKVKRVAKRASSVAAAGSRGTKQGKRKVAKLPKRSPATAPLRTKVRKRKAKKAVRPAQPAPERKPAKSPTTGKRVSRTKSKRRILPTPSSRTKAATKRAVQRKKKARTASAART